MKKLVSSLSLLALSFAAVAANAQDPECNGNGTWIGQDSRGLWCELPADIVTGGQYHLAKTSSHPQTSGAPILWVLPQVVVVGDGNRANANPNNVDNTEIVIDAGARIVGEIENSALVITRGAKLTANGTENDPIIFSSMDPGYSGKGEWGGVILAGFGEANECPGDAGGCLMEGIAADDFYFGGGFDPADYPGVSFGSGSLSHVVITEGGSVVDLETDGDSDPNSNSGDEINGLTLYAVVNQGATSGDRTVLSDIHIHDNLDDGIEFFGGDVDVDRLWLTCHQDDSVDWDYGYQGTIDGLSIVQNTNAQGPDPDHAFELASNPNNASATPVANGSVFNASLQLIGGASDVPFKLKEGTSAYFDNVLVEGYSSVACADVSSNSSAAFGNVEYDCDNSNGALPGSTSAIGFVDPTFWTTAQGNPGCN